MLIKWARDKLKHQIRELDFLEINKEIFLLLELIILISKA